MGRARTKAVGLADLKREVATWSREELEEFAVEQIWGNTVLRDRFERKLAVAQDPEAGLAKVKADIDRVLDIGFVEWRDVDRYIEKLESILRDVEAMGSTAPPQAAEAALYFVEEIPAIFNSIHDECELGMFCRDLVEATVKLALAAEMPVADLVSRLLPSYQVDDTCRLNCIPEVLSKQLTLEDDRRAAADLLEALLPALKKWYQEELRKQVQKLRRPRRSSKAPE